MSLTDGLSKVCSIFPLSLLICARAHTHFCILTLQSSAGMSAVSVLSKNNEYITIYDNIKRLRAMFGICLGIELINLF